MIPIGKTDWNAIRSEYIGGGISQRELAEKYGVSEAYLIQKANKEQWRKDRDEAVKKGLEKSKQKAADAISSNAEIAARIKSKLLRKLEREIDALPDMIGSETRNSVLERTGGKKGSTVKEVSKAYKLRDLAAAYKDLTSDMVPGETSENELMRDFVEASRRRLGNA